MRYLKQAIFYCCFWALGYAGKCQYNLVPNYSFEENVICPTIANGGPLPVPWYLPQNLSNKFAYCNRCSTYPNNYGVPFHSFNTGYQETRTGNGYAGIDSYNPAFQDGRIYLQTKLSDSLRSGKCYYGEIWINLPNFCNLAINNMGMFLTDTSIRVGPVEVFGIGLIPGNPQVINYGNPVINDTLNWVKVSGVFTAGSNAKYITIGNFATDANTTIKTVRTGGQNKASYYIEDVYLRPLDSLPLQADAGADKIIAPGDSAFVGSLTNGLTGVTWFNSTGTVINTGIPGFWVKPTATTFYIIEQTVCGYYSRDTVTITVDAAMPLRLLNYNAFKSGNCIKNTWQTANEVNVSHFNIQRSADGTLFTTIANIAANNNASNSYNYIDASPLLGVSYYRIECVDKDGKILYSSIKQINNNGKQEVAVYPNPVKNILHITGDDIKQVEVLNAYGARILVKNINSNSSELSLQGLSNGVYVIKVTGATGGVSMHKVIKE